MFEYFYIAYKNDIYKKRNKITFQKLRELKRLDKILFILMISFAFLYYIITVFWGNHKMGLFFIIALIINVLILNYRTGKYDKNENLLRCENYYESEIEEVKELLTYSQFEVFNSKEGIQYLMKLCLERKQAKTELESVVMTISSTLKYIAIPIVLSIVSVYLDKVTAYEAVITLVVMIILSIFIIVLLRMTLFPINDILKRDKRILAKLYDSLNYISLMLNKEIGVDAKII